MSKPRIDAGPRRAPRGARGRHLLEPAVPGAVPAPPEAPVSAGEATVSLVHSLHRECADIAASLAYSGRLELPRDGGDACFVHPDTAALIVRIIGEALNNAIKYSHPANIPGVITVAIQHDRKGDIAVTLTDDGVGLPESFDPAADGGVGFQVMRALSARLRATVAFNSTCLGLHVSLHVPQKSQGNGTVAPGRSTHRANGRSHRQGTLGERASVLSTGTEPDWRNARLLEAVPAAIYTTDAQGRITFYNEAASALWGCRPVLGKSEFCGSWKLYRPDGTPLPHDECPMALALKHRRPTHGMEAVAERPDGTRIPFIPYPTPLFDASGTLIGAVNMLVDISDRKRAEVALTRHRDEQAALFQFTDRLFRAASPTEVYDSALEAIQLALGCERASILLFDDADVMRFVAWRGLSEGYRRAVEGHSPWQRDAKDAQPICIEDVEKADLPAPLKAIVRAEGIGALAFIPIASKGDLVGKFMTYFDTPHALSDGNLNVAVTIARQLGFGVERMRAEFVSRSLAAIVGASDDAIVSKDLNGTITSWNSGAERLFGYTAEEAMGKPITLLIPEERLDEEPRIIERIKRGERIDHYETVRVRKDGSQIDVSLSVSPVKDASERIIGASKIARDVTERNRARARQDLLTHEIQHRTKNLYAVVLSIVARSFAGKRTVKEAEAAVLDRLRSLANTHVMLIDKDWQGADLVEVVRTEMSPYADQVQVDGPSLLLAAKAAQNFGLALHELATNAAKYGALSNAAGQVSIRWSVSQSNGSGVFSFRWQEAGGPPVSPPTQKGFGTAVLEQVLAQYFDTPLRVEFDARGVRFDINCSLAALTTE